MRVLAIADEPSRYYYDFYTPGMLKEFDLIIACGDLKKNYLEFLVTLASCPVLYVNGNHDERFLDDPPLGCICIEDTIFEYKGIRFLGLGGSYRYRPKVACMYTEKEMKKRIRKLSFKLWRKKGFDVLVTHAPAKGLGDLEDLPHQGFECFRHLIDEYNPKFHIHGHIHRNYGVNIPAVTYYKDTTIVNAFEYVKIDIEK